MIHFLRFRWIYIMLSLLVIVPGVFSLVRFGLKPAIDFTGGTLFEFRITNSQLRVEEQELRNTLHEQSLEVGSYQTTNQDSYILRLKPISQEEKTKLETILNDKYGEIDELRYETVGPTLGNELLRKTFIAALIAIIGILSYIAWAFKNIRFGISAIIALFHDVLVVIGVFSLLGHFFGIEVDALFVTAVLTTMSFSVHDTIVVFDRIRETQHKNPSLPYADNINMSLTETMGRSLNNSLTIIFMLLALFLMGGETIKWFIFALLLGTISGTYSSPFVATPILYFLHSTNFKKLMKRS